MEGLTELEIRLNVFLPDVGCHGNDGDARRDHANHGCRRHAVELRHDDVHKDEVEPVRLVVNLVDGFESVFLQRETSAKRTGTMASEQDDIRRSRHYSPRWRGTWTRSGRKSCHLRPGESAAFSRPTTSRTGPWKRGMPAKAPRPSRWGCSAAGCRECCGCDPSGRDRCPSSAPRGRRDVSGRSGGRGPCPYGAAGGT